MDSEKEWITGPTSTVEVRILEEVRRKIGGSSWRRGCLKWQSRKG